MAYKPEPVPTSRPVFYRDVVFNTVQAHRVFRRTYRYLSRKFYHISVITQILGDPDSAEKAEDHMREMMSVLATEIADEKARVETIRSNAGMTDLPVYDNPQKIHVAMKSPYDARYLHLVTDLDDLVMRINSLWMVEEIRSRENVNVPYRWQQKVLKCAGRIRSLSDGLRSKAKAKGHDLSEIDADTAAEDAEMDVAITVAVSDAPVVEPIEAKKTSKARTKTEPVAATA